MKKLNIIAIGILMAMGFSACSEDSFEEIYPDPSKSTSATCASLLTGIFYNHNNGSNFQASVNEYTYNSYWRLYTWENAFGRFAQTIGYENEQDQFTIFQIHTQTTVGHISIVCCRTIAS